ATFTAVYLADAATFLAFVPVLARLRPPAQPASPPPRAASPPPPSPPPPAASPPPAPRPQRTGFGQVLRNKAFVRVWALTAVRVTTSSGQPKSSSAGYAPRPGGTGPHGLALAFAANTLTVVAAQLLILRRLAGHRRTTAAALAALA